MNSNTTDPIKPKRTIVSLPFLIIAVTILGVGYFAGPWLMTQVMYQQEKAIASQAPTKNPVPAERPKLPSFGDDDDGTGVGEGSNNSGGQSGSGNDLDAEAIFAERDRDNNGKLEGDEISERLRGRLEVVDTDLDGKVSKEEFIEGMKSILRGRNADRGSSNN